MVDNRVDTRNGDPIYDLVERGATPAQIKWAEEQMRQGKPYQDGNGNILSGPGWSTSLPYADNKGSPAPGKEDRYRPIRDPDTLQPVTLGNAQYPPGNQLTPNALGFGADGTMTGQQPALAAIEKATPGYRMQTATAPTWFKAPAINGGRQPNYGGYTATARPAGLFAAGRGVEPGLVYRQQGQDPWAGMRGPSGGAQRMPAQRAPVQQQSSSGGQGTSPQVLAVRQALQRQAQASVTPQGGFQPVRFAGEATDVHGNDMAFQPRSSQTSTRSRTGY